MSHLLVLTHPCPINLECPEGVHVPGPASLELLKYIFSVRGKSVLDLGCGTGLFAVAAAKMGARDVWAVDIDPASVECAQRNAELNGVEITARVGDLFDPVPDRLFDLIITNPPQTPAPAAACGPKFGGVDGLLYFNSILRAAPDHLERGGELLTFLISLAHTRRFEEMLSERFRFRGLPKTRREFTREEYEGYWPGLFDFLCDLRARGMAEFDEETGRFFFTVRSYLAMRR